MDQARIDRVTEYAAGYTAWRFPRGCPVLALLDGREFARFTQNLRRPFDVRLAGLMGNVTGWLTAEFKADCSWTGSDEVLLAWRNRGGEAPFDGRASEITSVLASACTGKFNAVMGSFLPGRGTEMIVSGAGFAEFRWCS